LPCPYWRCWRPGPWAGRRQAGSILREMAATVLPGYVGTTLWLSDGGLGRGPGGHRCCGGGDAVSIFRGGARLNGCCCCRWPCPPMSRPMPTPTFCSSAAPQVGLRNMFGLEGRLLPEVRSLGGAVWVFIFSLYPYVPAGPPRRTAGERAPDGGSAAAGRPAAAPHPGGGPAAGPPGRGRRRGAGADGDPGRLRRGQLLRHPDLHHRHLQSLAVHGQPPGRGPAGHHAAGGGAGPAAPGAARPKRMRFATGGVGRAGSSEAQPLVLRGGLRVAAGWCAACRC
jgi:iron(III) transport system permease protein